MIGIKWIRQNFTQEIYRRICSSKQVFEPYSSFISIQTRIFIIQDTKNNEGWSNCGGVMLLECSQVKSICCSCRGRCTFMEARNAVKHQF